jgi:cadmium resistance transport/sequestration family protein
MIQTVLTSLLAFVSTNIDDIFILMLFFGAKKIKPSSIIAGQYLGIGTLVVLSLAGSFIGNFIDQRYIGILGLFPIFLAIKHVWQLTKPNERDEGGDVAAASSSIVAVAGVTIANGADNIGVYVPLLTTLSQHEKMLLVIVFIVMVYLWCLAGKYLASRTVVARQLERFGHVIMPVVLFLLGLFILIESGTFALLVA